MRFFPPVLAGVAVAAFIATFGLAYVGAFTDNIHAWQGAFVSAFLTVFSGTAAGALWDDLGRPS